MNRIACPDCGGDLGPKATKCRCGWKATQEALKEDHPGFIPCAGNSACRFPGRIWTRRLMPNERLCISHYYIALQNDSAIAFDDTVPPKEKMPGVRAKEVSGA